MDAARAIRNAIRYANLVERVRKIDPAAAEYMEGPGRELDSHRYWAGDESANQGRLVWAFTWDDTPQGYDYWSTLALTLNRRDACPT